VTHCPGPAPETSPPQPGKTPPAAGNRVTAPGIPPWAETPAPQPEAPATVLAPQLKACSQPARILPAAPTLPQPNLPVACPQPQTLPAACPRPARGLPAACPRPARGPRPYPQPARGPRPCPQPETRPSPAQRSRTFAAFQHHASLEPRPGPVPDLMKPRIALANPRGNRASIRVHRPAGSAGGGPPLRWGWRHGQRPSSHCAGATGTASPTQPLMRSRRP
jgi:hypothetical protein